ncbi:hypothetical protein BDQ12DRAFT_677901 [Crucibulum laeve]|uniref:Uncharacterized protein n=1 Tax=Crucibulum laeve TaxID=68775 RepID=A0A5C3MAK0_9AGAR|nr:hypothetical protein BDQ12DRAFT_677901 [Crucibulum laeve]
MDPILPDLSLMSLNGIILEAVTYGLVSALFLLSWQIFLVNIRSKKTRSREHIALSCYITVMFILSTTIIVSDAVGMRRLMQAIFRNDSTMDALSLNPPFFGLSQIAEPCFVLANWGADGLLIWRCLVIYRSYSGTPRWVVAISCILALLSIGTGIFAVVQDIVSIISVAKSVWIYCIISLLINLVITTMIITKLNAYRHRITKMLGSNHGTLYTNIMAMIIESALLTLLSLIFVIASFFISPLSPTLLMQILAQVQVLSPLWIIYRVAKKRAWGHNTLEEITSVAFTPGEMTFSSSQASSDVV